MITEAPEGSTAAESHWSGRLAQLAAQHRVPGAVLGILQLHPGGGEEHVEASYGVLSRATGVEVTTDTLFQIGSITKAWTATLAMQLVEQGKLDLDQPIVEVLPEMRLSDSEAQRLVTLRHLLTHTSGIDGDAFLDTGRGDDCLERYVARLGEVAQNFPVGAAWSYCNTGFSILGRVIEEVTGQVWDTAFRERLVAPLGLTHVATLPEEALLFRTAVGHVAKAGEEPQPVPVWCMERSGGPAGAITAMSVGALLAFARMHLSGGRAADGSQVLGEEATTLMQQHHADVPGRRQGNADSWGLGWMRFDWDGQEIFGHDGNTLGQSAFLRVQPSQGLAVALLTNGGNTRDLYADLYREVFAELGGLELPAAFAPPEPVPDIDLSPHAGRYEIAGTRAEVFVQEGEPMLRVTDTSIFAELEPEAVQEFVLHPVDPDLAAIREKGAATWEPVSFLSFPDGRPLLHVWGRSLPRVATAADQNELATQSL